MGKKGLPFRQIHLDFHTSPYIDGIGAQFNREKFVETLKKAHVNSINLFAKCHHGMYYYPTKIGTMHPNLNFDLFGEQIKACRENDIRTVAYTCVAWNEDWADRHPEWLTINAEGVLGTKKPFETDYYSWRSLCYNNKDYQRVLKDELKEIYEMYHPDGFWIDIIQGKRCICKQCSLDMRKMGLSSANIEDVEMFDKISETAFCREFYQYIKSLDTSLDVYFNSFPYELDDGENLKASSVEKRKYFDFVDIESLPSDQWGYTHFPVAANYLNKYEQEICMMNGKFHTAWGDFGSIRHENALEYECFRAIANGAKVCVGDQLHPVGVLDAPVYERIGKVFEKIEQMEPWLEETKKISEIGVLIPTKAGKEDPAQGGKSEEGAYRILSELHFLFDFVNVQDSFDGYRLLILPDHVELSDHGATKIEAYIQDGGKVLMSGSSGMREGKSQLPSMKLEHLGKCPFDVRYLRLNQEIFQGVPDIDHILYESGESVVGEGQVLAEVVEPYFSRGYDKFCSHRQTPPKTETSGEVGVIQCDGGIYLSFPVFRLYTDYGYTIYRDVVKHCIRQLMDSQILVTNLPPITELTLRQHRKGYVLHMLNYVVVRKAKVLDTIEEKFAVHNKEMKVKMGTCPQRVVVLPEQNEVPFTFSDGYTKFVIDCEEGYTTYLIS